jgi:hypothetical protein
MSYTTPVNGLEMLLPNKNTLQSKSQWVFFKFSQNYSIFNFLSLSVINMDTTIGCILFEQFSVMTCYE